MKLSILNHLPRLTTGGNFSPTTTHNHKNPPFFFFFSKPITLSSLSSSSQQQLYTNSNQEAEEHQHIIGDCLVFEEGIFEEDSHENPPINNNKIIQEEDLIPSNWKDIQAEINITKKERRKLAQDMEFGSKLQKKKLGYQSPKEYKAAKLRELNPIVLDNPSFTTTNTTDYNDNDNDSNEVDEGIKPTRLPPKNPKMAVYGRNLDDISTFFNSGLYRPDAAMDPNGARKLFSKEEKLLMNRRVPDLATATSHKWQPLHTVAASGEFYLVDTLMKYNVDINVSNKEGLMAIHKAILGKKHAICNYLLRNSAIPFVRDKDGATLMHYAVRTASTQMIKVLLLYNVDINLQDNDGWTPLHLAVQTCRTDVVRLLLIKKADQTLKTQGGLTPLDLCLYSGKTLQTYELIRLLKLPPKPRKHTQVIE